MHVRPHPLHGAVALALRARTSVTRMGPTNVPHVQDLFRLAATKRQTVVVQMVTHSQAAMDYQRLVLMVCAGATLVIRPPYCAVRQRTAQRSVHVVRAIQRSAP